MSEIIQNKYVTKITAMLCLVFALFFVSGPSVVIAGDTFNDVPEGSSFHDEITNIAEAGISNGCGGGNYCPENPVTRRQMAGFMTRGFPRAGTATGSNVASITTGDGTVTIQDVTIQVPGVDGGQFVFVQAEAALSGNASGSCPCAVNLRIRHADSGALSDTTFLDHIARNDAWSMSWLFVVNSGSNTFQLQMAVFDTGANNVFINSPGTKITAISIPFGRNGDDNL